MSPRLPAVAVGAGALLVLAAGSATAAPGAGHHRLPGSVPDWATAAHRTGATTDSTSVTFRVYLADRGGAAAARYAAAVSDPGSPRYRHYLTPSQFHARFSPSAHDVATVRSWLERQGFHVGHVPGNRKYVQASGTLGEAADAFDTSFGEFTVHGRTVRGNTEPLAVPDSLGAVEAVVGLDESQTLARTDTTTPPPPVFVNGRPCSHYWGEKTVRNTATPDGTDLPDSPSAFAPCGYAGSQLQGAYGMAGAIGSGTDGSGVTIGVIDAYASPTITSDLETYSAKHGLPPVEGHFRQVVAPGTYQHPENPRHDPGGWAGEETLDLEAVHTMAPGADMVYVGAPNNYRDLDAILNKVVDTHLADIVTNSYGYGGEALPRGYVKPSLDTQVQAAAEGISLLYSSGDSGDETGGDPTATPTPDWPASSPWVTAVGGTSLGVAKDDSRMFELGWETAKETLTSEGTWSAPSYLYGSGGGTSRLFAQPDYQEGVVPDSIARTYGGSAMRAVPDVSALGDPTTGMLVGETQRFPDGHDGYSEYRIGGTSLSSPLYAGMLALAEQEAGHPLGFANPALYAARSASQDVTTGARGAYPGAVRVDLANHVDASDGYVYSARTFDTDEPLTIHVRGGYDDVTGVGSPDGRDWLDAVAGR